MKRLAGIFLSILIIYVVYYDVKHGTLPSANDQNIEVKAAQADEESPFFEYEVKPGDTVLSILEKNQKGGITVPITQVIEDFQSLNKGLEPEKIQIGKKYKFPVYKTEG